MVESMRRNISMNGPNAQAKVQPHCSDARLLMLQNPYVSLLLGWHVGNTGSCSQNPA